MLITSAKNEYIKLKYIIYPKKGKWKRALLENSAPDFLANSTFLRFGNIDQWI